MDGSLQALEQQISKATSDDSRVEILHTALTEWFANHSGNSSLLQLGGIPLTNVIRPEDPIHPQDLILTQGIYALATKYGVFERLSTRFALGKLSGLADWEDSWAKPIEHLPCAHIRPNDRYKCLELGTRACSGCRLVSYCSATCQKRHWSIHKADCKHSINSDRWLPKSRIENRMPASSPAKSLGYGMALWGNIPIIDILNLEKNEGASYQEDLALAFMASGSLGSVVKTVNSIPSTYKENIRIVINDLNPVITARNLILLLILGGPGDSKMNADIALHFWYSTFLPYEYRNRLLYLCHAALKQGLDSKTLDVTTDTGTRIRGDIGAEGAREWLRYLDPSEMADAGQITAEFKTVMKNPQRKDLVDQYYSKLKPAHRLAVHEYREFGIVLPFGAANVHFNTPNTSLFDPRGTWLINDSSFPHLGYNIHQILQAGADHGCKAEDLFGCFYFYLSDQLNRFISKLRELNIAFWLFAKDDETLPKEQKSGKFTTFGLPPSQKYDRIDVANLVDDKHGGFRKVLECWGPLINEKNRSSTLLTYLMEWHQLQSGSFPESGGGYKDLINQARKAANLAKHQNQEVGMGSPKAIADGVPAFHENSDSLNKYLRSRGIPELAKSHNLQIKSHHTIVPPRVGGKLDDTWKNTRAFENDEQWYREVCLENQNFYARYVELGLKAAA